MGFWDEEKSNEDYPELAEGNYVARLFNVELAESKTKEPQINVTYTLKNKARMWQRFTFKPASSKWILWQMGVMGVNELVKNAHGKSDDMEILRGQYFDQLKALCGDLYVSLELTYEEYNGKTYSKVKLLDLSSELEFDKCEISYIKNNKQDNVPGINSQDEIPF